MKSASKTVYLDYAAATPMDPYVSRVTRPFLDSRCGNPSSLHHKGREAGQAVDSARLSIARLISARAEEIIFTSGGTESCNLAILGIAQGGGKGHIITTQIEHPAVLEPIKLLQKWGWKATFLPVNREGFISLENLKRAILKDTALVSVMYANNEIGAIQPIVEAGNWLRRINELRMKNKESRILFHTDACQAAGALDLNVNRLQTDLMSLSAGKIYGPKGIGCLYVRRGSPLAPVIFGGGQERGMRSGTENVAGIVGLAKAMELAGIRQSEENNRLTGLRNYLAGKIRKIYPKAILNGPQINKKSVYQKNIGRNKMGILNQVKLNRLPNNLNITFSGVEGEALMLYLDARGICVSTGSACAADSLEPSHVLKAIGLSEKRAKESIRITLGRQTTKAELVYLIKALKKVIPLILDER